MGRSHQSDVQKRCPPPGAGLGSMCVRAAGSPVYITACLEMVLWHGCMQLPDLSSLDISSHGLVWSVSNSRLLLSFSDVFLDVPDADDDRVSDGPRGAAREVRPRYSYGEFCALTPREEVFAVKQFLKLSSVPSRPVGGVNVAEIVTGPEVAVARAYACSHSRIVAEGRDMEREIREALKRANDIGAGWGDTVRASCLGGNKSQSTYMQFLKTVYAEARTADRDARSGSFYTGRDLERASVEHVVPQSWTRVTRMLSEFTEVDSDPVNMAFVARFDRNDNETDENSSKGTKPIRFGFTTAGGELTDALAFAPDGFTSSKPRQAAAARIVAYMFLKYPLLSSGRHGYVHGQSTFSGCEFYANKTQFAQIVELAAQPPDQRELDIAYTTWLFTGAVNPFVVSPDARQKLSNPSGAFHRLLLMRFRGVDHGSVTVREELRALRVEDLA